MSANEPVVGTAGRSDDRSPSMTELLAACAAASAVSTPPSEDAAAPEDDDAQRPDEGAPERDAA